MFTLAQWDQHLHPNLKHTAFKREFLRLGNYRYITTTKKVRKKKSYFANENEDSV